MAEFFDLEESAHDSLDELEHLEALDQVDPQVVRDASSALETIACRQAVFVAHAGANYDASFADDFAELRRRALQPEAAEDAALCDFACHSRAIRELIADGLGLSPTGAAYQLLEKLGSLDRSEAHPGLTHPAKVCAEAMDGWIDEGGDDPQRLRLILVARSGGLGEFRVAPLLQRDPHFLMRLQTAVDTEQPQSTTQPRATPEGFSPAQTAALEHSETLFAAWQQIQSQPEPTPIPGERADELQVHRPTPSIWNWVALAVLLSLSAASYLGSCGASAAEAPAGDS